MPLGWMSTAAWNRAAEVEAVSDQHHDGHEGRAGEQQDRLDDLDPRGRQHAAERHVHDHQDADHDDRVGVVETEQQLDQLAGTHHLGDQVERHHDQRARSRQRANRRLLETVRGHVGEGVLAEVAELFRDQEQNDRPADQEADRVDQAVKAGTVDQRRDTEERSGRHVVAGNREAVLEAGDTAAGGVEVLRRLGLGSGPVGDAQRSRDEQQEHDDGGPVGLGLLDGTGDRVGSQGSAGNGKGGSGKARGRRECCCSALHYFVSSMIWRFNSSNSELARRT